MTFQTSVISSKILQHVHFGAYSRLHIPPHSPPTAITKNKHIDPKNTNTFIIFYSLLLLQFMSTGNDNIKSFERNT